MMMDISNFYLMTPLKRPEYIRMKISDIPEEIIVEYKLRDVVKADGSIYIMAVRGMYGYRRQDCPPMSYSRSA